MDDFFDRDAAEDSEGEEEEEFDEETGEPIPRAKTRKATNGDLGDSSEEEEDDDDEEAARAVREGFIVDEDEEDEEERQRRRERRKRRREEKDAELEMLDEEDLDLIGETHPDLDRRQAEQSKFKRLKRGHRDDRATSEARGIEDIFDDEEEGADAAPATGRGRTFGYGDDLDDFIEQDEFPDEEAGGMDDEMGVRAPKRAGFAEFQSLKESGLDEAALEDMRGAFGDGDEFGWALDAEAANNEDAVDPDKPVELKDIFEPSQLVEKYLTDEDNAIRMTDVPERFQILRKPYKDLKELSEEEIEAYHTEEATWISNSMFARKRNLGSSLRTPFEQAVKQVLHFMNVEDFEPAFIFQNRKDYLIHSEQVPAEPDPKHPDAPEYTIHAEKLLTQDDLWTIVEQDLKFRAFVEKREAIRKSLETLQEADSDFKDAIFDDVIPSAMQIDDLQDLQDYLNFQYSQQLKDANTFEAEANGTQKRARGSRNLWDKVRSGPAYHVVRGFGITADAVAQNVEKTGRKTYTEDIDLRPDDYADTLIQEPEFRTGEDVLNAAKAMFVEELTMSPRMRRHLRKLYYEQIVFDVHRTEKGLKQIDEDHPYYEFKYLRNQEIAILLDKPELFLRMLQAERAGLVEVNVRLQSEKRIREELYKAIESDNFSEVADAWNALRKECVDAALKKLHKIMARGVKDTIKNECENRIAMDCRVSYHHRLDQAPFRPEGMDLGTIPRVLALTNGSGGRDDAICWAYMEESGRVQENGKFTDLRVGSDEKNIPDGKDIAAFVELVHRRNPDVIAVSGWSVEARNLYKDLQSIVEKEKLMGAIWDDPVEDRERHAPLEVVIVNDEVARLYHTSQRAEKDFPSVPPLTRYAIALARYMQSPLKEYASLGSDIKTISFDSHQNLIPEEKLMRWLETAVVDMVNLVGVDINDAVGDPYTGNLLQYVAGLGPRKAQHMINMINKNGGEVISRADLVGDLERNLRPAVGPVCWTNCASFVYVNYNDVEGDGPEADYLDNTRIHPEDYDLARKIAADALELDEEDIKAEVDDNGVSAVVRRLVKEDMQDRVNDLVLEQYAEQLERQMRQRKRATLETIRAELQSAYEELRRNFSFLTTDQIFTMLTGETRESLQEGMIVPVAVKRTFGDHIDVRLDCGMTGTIMESEFPEDVFKNHTEPRSVWSVGQTIRAKVLHVNRKVFEAGLTLREAELRKPFRRDFNHGLDEWDEKQESQDQKELRRAAGEAEGARAQRVIKHPLFRPFNAAQAVEFLGPGQRGDCVIRPSSKGADHLAVTWKVHEGVFQHIDVLELNKENEFSVGKILRIGGKWSYTDLDELIALHVRAMARMVEQMMGDERYQSGSRQQCEQWLTIYCEANPKRSMYAFCLNPKYPGYFYLCFKAGKDAPLSNWPVKVIPNAFELKGNKYPDMRALKNGFKLLFANQQGPGGGVGGANGIPRR